ncbi:hypothetical protein EV363DRAFT_1340921 [Boletus edulis]|nr:hypothetical protein EV363DRAFT_1340921 [Boletus edulis]
MTRTYWVCQVDGALREGAIPLSNLFDTTRCVQSRIGHTRSMMRRYCRSDLVSTHVSDEILYETSSDNEEGIDPNNITLEDMRQRYTSPIRRSFATATAAFRVVLKGSPTKLPIGQASESPGAGPSTPRRPYYAECEILPIDISERLISEYGEET